MIFHQLFEHESSTYTYLIADQDTKEAVLIDTVLETAERDLRLIYELDLKLIATIETHVHADHITGAAFLKEKTNCLSIVSKHSGVVCADKLISEGDVIKIGKHELKVLETQGHTNSCLSFVLGNMVFTGDLLFIRGTGRTDFQEGDSLKMFQNIHQKIFTLPDNTKIYPGHDYKGFTHSTVGQEKKYNPRVGGNIDLHGFVRIMNELNLAPPKKINVAVTANLNCGKTPII
jgi:sulfur dioxygenase